MAFVGRPPKIVKKVVHKHPPRHPISQPKTPPAPYAAGNSVNVTGTSNFDQSQNNNPEPRTIQVPGIAPTPYTAGNALITIPGANGALDLNKSLWIISLQTGTYTQYESDQVRRGIVWFPIRQSEMYVQFNIAWPLFSTERSGYNGKVSGFQEMQAFQNAIRLHQQKSALTVGNPQPITLQYYNNTGSNKSQIIDNNLPINGNDQLLFQEAAEITGNSINNNVSDISVSSQGQLQPLIYQGWINTVQKEYRRYKSYFVTSYRMNIINQANSSDISYLLTNAQSNSLVPNTSDVMQYHTGSPSGQGWYNVGTDFIGKNSINVYKIVGAQG